MSDKLTQDKPAAPARDKAAAIDTLLRAWVVDQLYDSPVSRDTELMNHLTLTALPDLARRILAAG